MRRSAGRHSLLTSEGFVGSNPTAPTKFLQLDGLFETLIGDPVTIAGNHRCMLLDGGGCPAAMAAFPFDHQSAPCADGIEQAVGAIPETVATERDALVLLGSIESYVNLSLVSAELTTQ